MATPMPPKSCPPLGKFDCDAGPGLCGLRVVSYLLPVLASFCLC